MSGPDDFVVTGHALERMEARWPRLVLGMSDGQIANLIHEEVIDALEHGRHAVVPPIELASIDLEIHVMREGEKGAMCWTADKKRGYVYRTGPDGLVVMTVVAGQERTHAIRSKLHGPRRRGKSRR